MSNIAFLFLPLVFSSLPAVLPFVSPSSQVGSMTPAARRRRRRVERRARRVGLRRAGGTARSLVGWWWGGVKPQQQRGTWAILVFWGRSPSGGVLGWRGLEGQLVPNLDWGFGGHGVLPRLQDHDRPEKNTGPVLQDLLDGGTTSCKWKELTTRGRKGPFAWMMSKPAKENEQNGKVQRATDLMHSAVLWDEEGILLDLRCWVKNMICALVPLPKC